VERGFEARTFRAPCIGDFEIGYISNVSAMVRKTTGTPIALPTPRSVAPPG
jgi:hypothetical protein